MSLVCCKPKILSKSRHTIFTFEKVKHKNRKEKIESSTSKYEQQICHHQNKILKTELYEMHESVHFEMKTDTTSAIRVVKIIRWIY